jgi:DNA polymerase I
VWRGQKSWNGVAILARGSAPIVTRTELPGDSTDTQARYIEAAVNGVLITSIYAPNGNPQPGPKFNYKLAWMHRLAAHAAELFVTGVPVVLAGDYNVVPTEHDIYPKHSYGDDALLQPQSRDRFARLLGQGWRDGIRALHPGAPMYSYWSYLRNRWPRDAGLRIDFLLLSEQAADRLAAAGVDRAVRGKANASDHAPVWIELRDVAARPIPRKREVRLPSPARGSTHPQPTIKPPGRRPLLVIDGDSFAHRAYHALPKSIRRRGDRPAGAILGFANLLLRVYREEKPRAVLVGWDTYETPTYRHEAFAPYQSGREFDDDLIEQLAIIPDFVAACGFANAKRAGYEADDFLAAAAAAEERRGGTALVASGDRDTFQLASDKTTILYPIRGGGVERIGPAEVRARYGVDPAQVPDFIALRGDPSDKLPGAPGVGAGSAAALLRQYGSLAAILKAGRFAKQAEALRLYRSIATMNRRAPLPRFSNQKPTWGRAAGLARNWELKQLAGRLEELARRSPGQTS